MNNIIDFPRAKKILTGDTFQPAPHSVIDNMIYCEDMNGYWTYKADLIESRLHELGLYDAFIEKLKAFEAAETKQSFEFISYGTGEIFALVEEMTGEAGRYFVNYCAFTDPLAFSCKELDLYSWRLPNAREEYAKELAELAAGV